MEQSMQERWEQAVLTAREKTSRKGIGTLGEKQVHCAVKYTIEPNDTYHEIRIGSFVADVVTPQGIVEVQTRNFRSLSKKLGAFLQTGQVTVVHPVAWHKWICWVDGESGEVSCKRRSPKVGQALDVFYELYWIRTVLKHENLTLAVWLMDMEEYRLLNGWSRDKKRGASRYQQVPLRLGQIVTLQTPKDYAALLPPMEGAFTKKELAKAAHRSPTWAQRALATLKELKAVAEVGKRGREKLYQLYS